MRKVWYEENIQKYIESQGYIFIQMLKENGLNSRILIWCGNKEHEPYEVSFKNFKGNKSKKGTRCSKCVGGKCLEIIDIEKYLNKHNFKLISNEYKNIHDILEIQCLECGEIMNISLNVFKSRVKHNTSPCNKCQNRVKINIDYIKKEIEKNKYELLSKEYDNSNTKLLLKCVKGHKYTATWAKFQQGRRCPYCHISKGEQKIMDFLHDNNIYYIYNKEYFKDLLSPLNFPLRPDFIIENKRIWIEFDGEFHYKNMTGTLEKNLIHDKIKDEYAIKNGWKLIRIPYWEFDNIEKILKKELNL